jgi:hypothetical protein
MVRITFILNNDETNRDTNANKGAIYKKRFYQSRLTLVILKT